MNHYVLTRLWYNIACTKSKDNYTLFVMYHSNIYMIYYAFTAPVDKDKLRDLVPYWRWCSPISSCDNRGGGLL